MKKKLQQFTTNKYVLFFLPLWLSISVAFVFYPGAMSYDTLHALRANRNGVIDSVWPPMVSYVWRFIDLISTNPSLMHFSQILILFISVYFIIIYFVKELSLSAKILIFYVLVPVLLATLGVIWKDVLMSSFLFSGLAITLLLMKSLSKKWQLLLKISFLPVIFLGICSRHNAVTGAVPILFLFSYVVCKDSIHQKLKLLLSTILIGFVLTGVLFLSKGLIDTYSLPSLTKMSNPSQYFIRVTKTLDVAGATVCTGENLFHEINPHVTAEEIKNGYDPKHVNSSAAVLAKIGVDPKIDRIWLNTFIHYPICAWYNKFHMTRFMLGANSGAQYLITKEEIDDNEFGYKFEKSNLRELTYKYITAFSKIPFLRPIFILLMAIVSFVYLIRSKKMTIELITVFMSGLFYLGSLVLFGNASDARLPFYSTSCFYLVAVIGFLEYRKARRANEFVFDDDFKNDLDQSYTSNEQ